MNKTRKFLSAAFTLTGTIIGAGILGLPYVFAQSGFLIGLFWLIFLGAIVLLVNLYIGEITLRTKDTHQLPGYSEKYLGLWGKRIMFLAVIFGVYSALLAYLIGEGQSLSKLFTGGIEYSLLFGVGFWVVMTTLLQGGLKRLKNIGYWGVIAIISIIFVVFFLLFPGVRLENIAHLNMSKLFLPYGIVLFALLGFTSIPELRREVGQDRKLLKKSILLGVLIPIVLYIMFSFVFVGVLGKNISEVATLSFGGILGIILLLLGIFTMMTSFFVLSFSLKDYFIFDLKKRKILFLFVSIFPLILYFLVYFFNLAGFVKVLGIGGAISGGIMGILILLINIKAKKKTERKPEYSIPINWFIIGILSLIFLAGIFLELL
ncbi:MAG TPA: aromatic amino acid transport family protein [Bacillota bacterium]|nr:aromatic amino acid transport family protein [Bacillota bacterium]